MKGKFAGSVFMHNLIGEINDKIDSRTSSMVETNNERKKVREKAVKRRKEKKEMKIRKIQMIKKSLIEKGVVGEGKTKKHSSKKDVKKVVQLNVKD